MSFESDIRAFVEKTEARTRAVTRSAIQALDHDASVPRAEGGRMPVDTGTLRASIVGEINGGTGQPVSLALARWQPGDTFRLGWTVVYAWPMEVRYGFARGAAEKWSRFVDSAVSEARSRGL
jgi:hypothetical protein